MSGPSLQLFKVECRGREGITTFFVPARSPDEAIIQAMTSASDARVQYPEVIDPFQEMALEVRVGTYKSTGSSKIIFDEWRRLSN